MRMVYHLHRDPQEIEFARALTALLHVLERDMDEAFTFLLHDTPSDPKSPRYRAARAANRIVLSCRRLVDEIRRYENTRWWAQDEEPEEDDIDF